MCFHRTRIPFTWMCVWKGCIVKTQLIQIDTELAGSVLGCLVYSVESIFKLYFFSTITFFLFLALCGVVYIQLIHIRLNNRVYLFVTYFIIIVVVCLRWLYHHILPVVYTHSWEIIFVSLLQCSQWYMHIVWCMMTWMSFSFVCTLHCRILIIIQIDWKHWMHKTLVSYTRSSVCQRWSPSYRLYFVKYMDHRQCENIDI